jgi:threonine/homoserine/homoserine lactone efflux protein
MAQGQPVMSFNLELVAAMAMFAFVTSVTPGPNNMMLLASGVNFGVKRSLPHWLGVSLGHFLMLLLVGAGLERLLTAFPFVYQVMKVAGFAYLVYLAWGVARSGAPQRNGTEATQPIGFLGAAAFQWVNPKAWIMSIAYFSNYMPTDASLTFVVLTCMMFSAINFPSVGLWVWLGAKLEHHLQQDTLRKIFNWTMALLLVVSMIPVLFV